MSPLARALIGVNVALSLALAVQLRQPGLDAVAVAPALAALQPPPSLAPPGGSIAFTLAPLGAFSETGARPLFSRSRRPVPAPAREIGPAVTAASFPDIALVGIVVTGDRRIALLGAPSRPIQRLAEGEVTEGWRLESVGSASAVFRQGAAARTLRLDPKGVAARVGRPAVVPVPR